MHAVHCYCFYVICVQKHVWILPRALNAQDGHTRVVQGLHFGQVLYRVAEILGNGEEITRCVVLVNVNDGYIIVSGLCVCGLGR